MTALVTTGDLISAADWNSLSMVIADDTLAADTGTITMDNISQAFAHLRLVINARSDAAVDSTEVSLRFNNSGGTNYISQELLADGTTVSTSQSAAASSLGLGFIAAVNATASYPGSITVDILDYTSTTWRQQVISHNSYRDGTSGPVLRVNAGEWNTAAAISRIDLLVSSNFVTGSRFTLYGHRGL